MTDKQIANVVAPQFAVTITIVGNDADASVSYSFTVPQEDGGAITFQNISKCNLFVFSPTNCLFLLDYASTQAGWSIDSITPVDDNSPLQTLPGPLKQSYMTIDPFRTWNDHRFFINFLNANTTWLPIDPQETNVPTTD